MTRLQEIRAAHRPAIEGTEEAEWAERYARELLEDLSALLPGRWTLAVLAAELQKAETERQAQQPQMDPAMYYAEWLAVRTERGEVP